MFSFCRVGQAKGGIRSIGFPKLPLTQARAHAEFLFNLIKSDGGTGPMMSRQPLRGFPQAQVPNPAPHRGEKMRFLASSQDPTGACGRGTRSPRHS